MMIAYLRKRKARKIAREWLRQAVHVRNLRGDIAPPEALRALDRAVLDLHHVLDHGCDPAGVDAACSRVAGAIRVIYPRRSFAWLRENFEIALVAVAVAMAFRTYFVQPFKIPTGSMQPTLYGIHYHSQSAPGRFDRPPLNILRWLVAGERYAEYRAQTSGIFSDAYLREDDSTQVYIVIGGVVHGVPRGLMSEFRLRPGESVVRGQVLASGVRVLGDHIFVNRVRWNFLPPERGDVMVFKTRDIPQIDMDTHYIKRMVGMPNEDIGIDPPDLLVNERVMLQPEMIHRIAAAEAGYQGFKLAGAEGDTEITVLSAATDRIQLGPGQYAAFGDNTGSSLDSRYWGPVMQDNLVGPAFWVYWPFSGRWGRIH